MVTRVHGPSQDRRQAGPEQEERISGLAYGLILGPAVALLVAVILDLDLALGLVYGAALGALVGLVLEAEHARRHPTDPQ